MSGPILHGGDYNPEQWLDEPAILDEDFRLFDRARINWLTLGVFAWSSLEPEEGRYCFDWMDDQFDRTGRAGIRIALATPSGGKPNWLARAYPEVRRVDRQGLRAPQGERHNHCLTSPVYRQKTREINGLLAERYGTHRSLLLWHISNELSGHCYCPLCFGEFRVWLRNRYGSLDALNAAYWSRFWGHTYSDWEEINYLDPAINGLVLDWSRFMTHQCRTFLRNEAEPLRKITPDLPITTNLMKFSPSYNDRELAAEIDIVSWDSYPRWHLDNPEFDESGPGLATAFNHNLFRSMKAGRPFLLMESTPSQHIHWGKTSPLRRPGIHRLSALQAIAHGSDSIGYFQMRQSRGCCEQFHGAVISHSGTAETRVFREVAELGRTLEKLEDVIDSRISSPAAILFDQEIRWALEGAVSPQHESKQYLETAMAHYQPLWRRGISTDVIGLTSEFSGYSLVIAPMAYLLSEETAERLAEFVRGGGTLLATYHSGVVNETTLCHRQGAPGPLRRVLGLSVEEFDALPAAFRRSVQPTQKGSEFGLSGRYEARHYLDLVQAETAHVLAVYGEDFYAGRPALTENSFGQGRAFYVASRNDDRFLEDVIGSLADRLDLPRALREPLPVGVSAQIRGTSERRNLFLLNFRNTPAEVALDPGNYWDPETGKWVTGKVSLEPFGSIVLRAPDGLSAPENPPRVS